MAFKGIIAKVIPGSIARELDLAPGDRLLAVNGQPVQDIIDLSFALADENVELLIEKQDGEQELLEIEKEYDEDLGLEFESAVFDSVRRCANRCIFCFVDQMPPGMRESLYVKDDDYRLSFLYGNFVTLSNLGPRDFKRIRQLHLSPLYVSVHVTDGDIRKRMLNNERASQIMQQLKDLVSDGIELHTQVVLCPGVNDGDVLAKTIDDLAALYPQVLTMAIVPVGLTRYRDECYPLNVFTRDQAADVINLVQARQKEYREKLGTSFVFLADEFYMGADYPVPDYDAYEGFPQLENGVGLVRSFLAEWEEQTADNKGYDQEHYIDVVCGVSAAKILKPLLAAITIPNLNIRVVPVENRFFGPHVTVTGLLTGKDIIDNLSALPGLRTGVIIPGIALRKGESVFLDNLTPEDIAGELKVPVRSAYFAQDLHQLLMAWR